MSIKDWKLEIPRLQEELVELQKDIAFEKLSTKNRITIEEKIVANKLQLNHFQDLYDTANRIIKLANDKLKNAIDNDAIYVKTNNVANITNPLDKGFYDLELNDNELKILMELETAVAKVYKIEENGYEKTAQNAVLMQEITVIEQKVLSL